MALVNWSDLPEDESSPSVFTLTISDLLVVDPTDFLIRTFTGRDN